MTRTDQNQDEASRLIAGIGTEQGNTELAHDVAARLGVSALVVAAEVVVVDRGCLAGGGVVSAYALYRMGLFWLGAVCRYTRYIASAFSFPTTLSRRVFI